MLIDEDLKKEIDSMSYEQLLDTWRNAPARSPYFQGEVGDYYSSVMVKRKNEVGNVEHVATSKRIGWK